MSYKHYFEPLALKEYIDALKWYKQRSVAASINFVKEMDAAIKVICSDLKNSELPINNSGKLRLKNILSILSTQ